MFADGSNGSVQLFDDHIVIRRKGFANILTQGLQGDKTVPFASITAVQLRPAGALMGGLIQFTILGGREFRGGMLEATKDENAVIFEKKQEPAFLALRDAVQQAISRGAVMDRGSSSNPAGELSKLAELVEKGYLTRDEYDAQKRAILQQSSQTSASSEPEPPERTTSIRSRVNAMPSAASVEVSRPVKKKRHPLLIAAALIAGAIILLSYLGSNLKESGAGMAASSGDHWKQVGGLDDSENFKFVEVDKPNAGAAVYDDAISKLCGGGGCVQVGFFLVGDSIPPSTSRSAFFRDGGWAKYTPAAVYFTNEFTKWDCEKAGSEGAPASALCGEGS